MSGNADSKQTSTPTCSERPPRSVACSRAAPVPAIMFCGAALLIFVSQPSSWRNGMYSPNGTSRVLTYVPSMPFAPISAATLVLPPAASSASWLTRICVPTDADRALSDPSSAVSRLRSNPTLLSPQTIRSACAARPAVRRWLALTRAAGEPVMIPGWTRAMVMRPAVGRAQQPDRRPFGHQGDQDARVRRYQREADQPYAADRRQGEDRGVLPLARPVDRPAAADALPGPDP